eukprot:scaffold3282_cov101-Isochrysis_galbana.AAC.6
MERSWTVWCRVDRVEVRAANTCGRRAVQARSADVGRSRGQSTAGARVRPQREFERRLKVCRRGHEMLKHPRGAFTTAASQKTIILADGGSANSRQK